MIAQISILSHPPLSNQVAKKIASNRAEQGTDYSRDL